MVYCAYIANARKSEAPVCTPQVEHSGISAPWYSYFPLKFIPVHKNLNCLSEHGDTAKALKSFSREAAKQQRLGTKSLVKWARPTSASPGMPVNVLAACL